MIQARQSLKKRITKSAQKYNQKFKYINISMPLLMMYS